MKQFWYSIAARSVYLLLIIINSMNKGWSSLPQNLIVFFALLVLWIPAMKNKKFFTYDALFILLFAGTTLLEIIGMPLVSTVFGIDKLFHLATGALIALVLATLIPGEKTLARFISLFLLVCVIGVGWEAFEWLEFSFRPVMALTMIDTYLDIAADLLGAAIVFTYAALR